MSALRPASKPRRAAALLAVGGLLALTAGVGLTAGAGPAAASAASSASSAAAGGTVATPAALGVAPSVAAEPTVTIVSVSPQLPVPIVPTEKLHITVRIANPTFEALDHLVLQVNRGDPIMSEENLAAALITPPPATDLDIPAVPVVGALAPQSSRTVVLTVIAGFDRDTGLCLACDNGNDGIYPIDVALRSATDGTEFSRAHTLLPAFGAAPKPVQVSWLWPLIDGPHRGTSDTVFTDDALARSVSAGGRLDRALKVAELVKNQVRLTLVIDPELIDALSVMAHGYTVQTAAAAAATPPRVGRGGPAAAAWLKRLKAATTYDDVSLTGYADPDVDAVVRHGDDYSTALAPQVAARVAAVLGRNVTSDVAWPPGENLTSAGLDATVGSGATSVLLSDTALPGAADRAATPDAVSPLPSATGTDDALVLSSALQPTVLAATGRSATVADAHTLAVQLAVRAAANPSVSHYVVLAPTRYVDAEPALAAGAMLTVAEAPWSQDVSVRAAVASVAPVDRGALAPATATGEIAARQMRTMTTARIQVAAFRDCLTNQSAPTLLGGFAGGLARATSAYWRLRPSSGQTYAAAVLARIIALEAKVSIKVPPGAQYTLASSDAPLEVTVRNDLNVSVYIRIRITALDGAQGFRAETVPVQTIDAGAQQQIKVPAHVDRSGHFRIRVDLLTPHNLALARSRTINVNSTALGAVALWITGIALGVLVLALVVRFVRRFARRGQPKSGPPPRTRPGTATEATDPRPATAPGFSP